MWLSKQGKKTESSRMAETGEVTLTGETVAVTLDSERRGLTVYAPDGYQWTPRLGQKALVLKTEQGLCVVGVPSEGKLAEGEVGLSADGGAAVTLKRDGRVVLTSRVELEGSLTVNGESLEEAIRRIAAQVVVARE